MPVTLSSWISLRATSAISLLAAAALVLAACCSGSLPHYHAAQDRSKIFFNMRLFNQTLSYPALCHRRPRAKIIDSTHALATQCTCATSPVIRHHNAHGPMTAMTSLSPGARSASAAQTRASRRSTSTQIHSNGSSPLTEQRYHSRLRCFGLVSVSKRADRAWADLCEGLVGLIRAELVLRSASVANASSAQRDWQHAH